MLEHVSHSCEDGLSNRYALCGRVEYSWQTNGEKNEKKQWKNENYIKKEQ